MIIMATDVQAPRARPPLPERQPRVRQPAEDQPPKGQPTEARPAQGQPTEAQQAQGQQAKSRALLSAFYVTVLLATVTAALLPAVLFQPHSRIFLLKLAAVALFASMPGLLYVQFIRFKGPSLYDEFVINLFRLRIDRYCNLPAPPRHTSYYVQWLAEREKLHQPGTDNLYRRKFETVYGERAVSTRALFATRRPMRSEGFYPVVLATALLCIGWAIVVEPELYHNFNLLGSLPFSGQPELPYQALQFGFIGAYWFILQDLTRRYFRQDLKTAAYVSASVRMVVVTITVATVALVPLGSPAQLNVLAFFIGVFPQIGVQVLKSFLGKVIRGVPNLSAKFPLSDLDGLTVWDQARLLEEGIEDMHALATANLVDLLLGTRVSVNTLVDWVDQALLYLCVPGKPAQRPAGDELTASSELPVRGKLRMFGIRTATDLIRVWNCAGPNAPLVRKHISAVFGSDEESGQAAVEAILTAMEGNPNLVHVKAFREHDWTAGNPARSGDRP